LNEQLYKARAEVAKAMAHQARLKIISILAENGDTCACEFTGSLNLSQPSVSKHLSVLRNSGIISSKKEGLNVIYKLEMPCAATFFSCIDEILLSRINNRKEALGLDED